MYRSLITKIFPVLPAPWGAAGGPTSDKVFITGNFSHSSGQTVSFHRFDSRFLGKLNKVYAVSQDMCDNWRADYMGELDLKASLQESPSDALISIGQHRNSPDLCGTLSIRVPSVSKMSLKGELPSLPGVFSSIDLSLDGNYMIPTDDPSKMIRTRPTPNGDFFAWINHAFGAFKSVRVEVLDSSGRLTVMNYPCQ